MSKLTDILDILKDSRSKSRDKLLKKEITWSESTDELLLKIWNLKMKDGRTIKAATIEQPPRKRSICYGCSAPCCQGIFRPVLNAEEFESRKFPIAFNQVPLHIKVQAPKVEYLITLNVDEKKGCPYFNWKTKKCNVWDNCPAACKAYDCRDDNRPEIKRFVKQRRKEWKKKDRLVYLIGRNSSN